MPQKANGAKETITIHLGERKKPLVEACAADGRTPSDVLRELVRKWLRARERQRQRDAAAGRKDGA